MQNNQHNQRESNIEEIDVADGQYRLCWGRCDGDTVHVERNDGLYCTDCGERSYIQQ